jgi:hypothetical protein
MKLSERASNVWNGTTWQMLRNSEESANTIAQSLSETYERITPVTVATVNLANSMNSLARKNVTIGQLCEWVERNKGARIKNKKDFEFILYYIASLA